MKAWILQTGEPLPIDSDSLRPMRAMNLSEALIEHGHEVMLWSSDFNHFSKSHRLGSSSTINHSEQLTIKLIQSRGYKSHFGIERLIDHAQLGWNLRKMLRSEIMPDVAFIGYPPIEPAWVMVKWLKAKNVPILLDVKDAWPDLLLNAVPQKFRLLAKLVLTPYFLMMKGTFRSATALSSVTDEFLQWSADKAGREREVNDLVLPLSPNDSDLDLNDVISAELYWDSRGITANGRRRMYFVGSLTNNFDFSQILAAAPHLDCEIIIAGDGPLRTQLIESNNQLENVFFPGWISSAQAFVLAQRSTFALGPLIDRVDFEMSIPNKFIDALKMGKPMLTSNSGVAGKLLLKHGAGRVYSNSDDQSFIQEARKMLFDSQEVESLSRNAKDLYITKFSHREVYGRAVDKLSQIMQEGLK